MSSDSELFIVSNVCPGRSTPCWGWPGPPAPSSSRCPAGTRASSPGPASRGDTCSVTCHVSGGQPWSRFLRIPILTILTTLLLNPRPMVSKWKDTFYILLSFSTKGLLQYYKQNLWSFGGDTVLQIWNKNESREKLNIIKINNIHRATKVLSDLVIVCFRLNYFLRIPRKVRYIFIYQQHEDWWPWLWAVWPSEATPRMSHN